MADNEKKQETEAETAKTASAGGEGPAQSLLVVVAGKGVRAEVLAREVVAVERGAKSVMIAVEETVTWSRTSSLSTEYRRL